MRGLLSAPVVAALAEGVADALQNSRAAVKSGGPSLDHFADVLTPSEGLRYDLKLDLSTPVRAALKEAVSGHLPSRAMP